MRHRGLVFDSKDHPDGLATLVIAADCTWGCVACCNKHLHSLPILDTPVEDLVAQIKANTFNNCVVLAGLEWTEQIEDVYTLLDCGFNIILYTHWTEDYMRKNHPTLYEYSCWVKYGEHRYSWPAGMSQGIPLSSKNQYIKKTIENL